MVEFNKVILVGNLTREPELRYTPQATPAARFSLAVGRPQVKEGKPEVDYFDIVVFGRQAETCKEFLHKGSSALVEGRIQQRRWEGAEGQSKSKVEVVAQTVKFLTPRPMGKPEVEGSAKPEVMGQPETEPEDDLPF